ncbi:MAG: hypothetical protein HQL99_13005 [Magnetococcales bacterium]|nr:hypothetical protein [Magnetococcales bacterium]
MSDRICLNTGLSMASLLLLSWPAAYWMNHGHADPNIRSVPAHGSDSRRHAVNHDGPCASLVIETRAFRMGIDSAYPPFARKSIP